MNFDHLKSYAIWYYLKYFPSIKKLEQKIFVKSKSKETTKKILNEIKSIFSEENIISSLVKNYYERGKSKNYIRNNLKLKLFDDSFIEKEIQTFFSDETPNLYLEKVIISKILEQKEKNKSIISIKNSLLKSGYEREIIDNIISKNDFKDNISSLKNEIEKLQKLSLDKNKIIKKLLNKGFNYEDIKKLKLEN